jgi:hypothetical protein
MARVCVLCIQLALIAGWIGVLWLWTSHNVEKREAAGGLFIIMVIACAVGGWFIDRLKDRSLSGNRQPPAAPVR